MQKFDPTLPVVGQTKYYFGSLYRKWIRMSPEVDRRLRTEREKWGVCWSFAFFAKTFMRGKKQPIIDELDGASILMDSGAFSARTIGLTIDIGLYTEFVQEFQPYVERFISLDVGGEQSSVKNYLQLKKIDERIMPVWHLGESYKTLELYLDNCDMVGIGGAAWLKIKKSGTRRALYRLFSDDMKWRYPPWSFHALGLCMYDVLFENPWYSVDSTQQLLVGQTGGVMLPSLEESVAIRDVDTIDERDGITLADLKATTGKRIMYNVLRTMDLFDKKREYVPTDHGMAFAGDF